MSPEALKQILDCCKQQIDRFEQSNNTGFIELRCCPNQGQYKVECRCGDVQNFLIAPADLAVWNPPPLPRQRQTLTTVEEVIAKLDSALFETFCLQQGYATIMIWRRGLDGQYGLQFCPSIIHGIKLC
ncbi:hypothetical protein ACF3DV_22370 [Chlorogloeopsis fritschii PCC 9212]|jgi:hypothetical protein|uniref:Uncharacterized protein n=1 Tax=Chlorogloeopsis fritschii PCC 6912 TaxID=211165 RepID=A0A433N4H9_CHLFR|nr:hypothetical protein [Chlorogloeopsis fritschii]MBF2003914.1 hypothetical protein [Chlorogloeopsis fritschii C42_A2020_084]RUR76231.1 hypothetical protein PCC6912_44030 [Chlorogloeopsis fritschii PCC 6912]